MEEPENNTTPKQGERLAELEQLYADLSTEHTRIRGDLATMERQLAGQTMSYDDYLRVREENNRISAFLRQNYRLEILSGQHANLNLSQVVIRYLLRERGRWRVKFSYWWHRLTSGSDGDSGQ